VKHERKREIYFQALLLSNWSMHFTREGIVSMEELGLLLFPYVHGCHETGHNIHDDNIFFGQRRSEYLVNEQD
jgi:hypothetical protein